MTSEGLQKKIEGVVPAKAGTQYSELFDLAGALVRNVGVYWVPALPAIKSGVGRNDASPS